LPPAAGCLKERDSVISMRVDACSTCNIPLDGFHNRGTAILWRSPPGSLQPLRAP
jgi:hypothetical protein